MTKDRNRAGSIFKNACSPLAVVAPNCSRYSWLTEVSSPINIVLYCRHCRLMASISSTRATLLERLSIIITLASFINLLTISIQAVDSERKDRRSDNETSHDDHERSRGCNSVATRSGHIGL